MNRVEAFEILGLSRDSSADQIRRAYLKLLRKHKPEADPEGFKRLREAYETAREEPSAETRVEVEIERSPRTEGTAGPERPTRFLQEMLELREVESRFARVPDDAPDAAEQRIEIARRGVEAHPENTQLRRLLAGLQAQAGEPEAAAETLRQAHADGLPDMRSALVIGFPAQASEEEWEAWTGEASPLLLLRAVESCVLDGQDERARQIFELAQKKHGASLEEEPLAPRLLRILIAAQGRELRELASEAEEWLQTAIGSGALDADTRSELGPLWVIARELASLHPTFPSKLRRAIARALLDGQLTEAGDAMHEFALDQPGEAVHAAAMLESTPVLFHFYHHLLSGPLSTTYSDGLPPAVPVGALLVLLLLVFRCAGEKNEVRQQDAAIARLGAHLAESLLPSDPEGRILFVQCKAFVDELRSCELAERFWTDIDLPRCSTAFETLGELAAQGPEDARPPEDAPSSEEAAPGIGAPPPLPTGGAQDSGLVELRAELPANLQSWATATWVRECRSALRPPIPEAWAEELAELRAHCSHGLEDFERVERCYLSARTLDALSTGDCVLARNYFDRVNARRTTDDPEASEYQVLAEIHGLVEEKCP